MKIMEILVQGGGISAIVSAIVSIVVCRVSLAHVPTSDVISAMEKRAHVEISGTVQTDKIAKTIVVRAEDVVYLAHPKNLNSLVIKIRLTNDGGHDAAKCRLGIKINNGPEPGNGQNTVEPVVAATIDRIEHGRYYELTLPLKDKLNEAHVSSGLLLNRLEIWPYQYDDLLFDEKPDMVKDMGLENPQTFSAPEYGARGLIIEFR